MFTFLIFEILSAVVGIIALGVLIVQIVRHSTAGAALKKRGIYIPAIVLVIAFFSGLIANKTYPPNFAMPAFMHSHAPGSVPASIPFGKIIEFFNYWTYNNQVPGPMLRVREGDTIELTLTNHPSSLHPHNIDLHAVTGPGGGAVLTNVKPGKTKTFKWKALNPGLYVYHC